MRRDLLLLVPAALVVMVGEARAAETGALRGKVVDDTGAPIPDATVTVSGVNMAGERTAKTGADGEFIIVALPPGVHQATVSHPSFASLEYTVNVRIDETGYLPATLKAKGVAGEEMVVEEALPVIDATRSAVSTSLDEELIQNLPVGRSYQSVVNMVPGVYGRIDTQNGGPSTGNPSVRGEGQYGNNYLIDGISTRDPATKTFGTDVNFDAIQEIQVYTDGLPAEFGEATGMLVNVVTKDGGDEHFGTVGYWLDTDASSGQYDILDIEKGKETPTDKRDFMTHELSLTAGGPILKDKLWYFASADLGQGVTHYESMDPDNPYTRWDGQGFAKLTWFVMPDLTVQYQFGYGRADILNYETSGLYDDSAQSKYLSTDLTHIFTTRWRPNEKGELELKVSSLTSHIDVEPKSGDEDTPQIQDLDTGAYTQNYDTFDNNKRTRLGGSLKFTQVVDNALGDHKFKAGVEYWDLTDERHLVYTGDGEGRQWWRSDSLMGDGSCTAETDYVDCYGYTLYGDAGPIGHEGRILGSFLQDDWQPVEPVTLNLGVRLDQERLFQNDGEEVINSLMPAPRLGGAWDITNDSKTVLTVNYGRYYDLAGNAFADWGDTRSAYKYSEYQWNGSDYDLIWVQDPETDPLVYCTDQSIKLNEDRWDKQVADGELSPDDAKYYKDGVKDACGDARLKPYHSDKLVVGIKREIIPLLAVGIKGIMSHTADLPEDVDYNLDTWVIMNPESKYRDYRALELTVERKYDGVWQGLASYTLSEAKGTTPGQFEIASGGQTGSNGNDVGVYDDDVTDGDTRKFYFDNGYGWLLDGLSGLGREGTDQAGWYGYLPYHSFHQVKLAGSYTAPWGTTFGTVYEFDSGHAWQKRGFVELYGDYFGFPEGRGTRFMPAVHYWDLRVAHSFSWAKAQKLELSLDVFNVLDLEAPITYYENDNELLGMTMYRQSPRAVRAGLRYTY